ncbi:MAG TPA: T9SS type B sorting domain-containing protein, partial [Bacteroidetes bacterium]|nr:T9SS type B sorting domain-containing protein [Bacteroidota bacterium]
LTENFAAQYGCAYVGLTNVGAINLTNTSGNSTAPTANSVYDGAAEDNLLNGDGCLASGDSLTISVTVEIDINCDAKPDPLANTATISGVDNMGNTITDDSDDGTDLDGNNIPDNETGDPNDPSILLIPDIAITQTFVGATEQPNGNFLLDFRFDVENTGNVPLADLSVTDPFNFPGAVTGVPTVSIVNVDGTVVPLPSGTFDGVADLDMLAGAATDLLEPGQSFIINMSVEVDPVAFGQLPPPVENIATATGMPVDIGGTPLTGLTAPTDDSDDATGLPDGGDPNSDNPGAVNDNGAGGTDDPTILSLPSVPEISKALAAAPTLLPNGNYSVQFDFNVANVGGSDFCQIAIQEDFATQYGCAFVQVLEVSAIDLNNVSGNSTSPTANPVYDGLAETNILSSDGCLSPGDSLTVSVTVELDMACQGIEEPLSNSATVSVVDAGTGEVLSDDSDDATDLDADGNPDNETGGPDDETLLSIPEIAVAKAQIGSTLLPNGNFEVTYKMIIQNTGNATLTNVALEDDLATQFAPAYVSAATVSLSGTANTLGGLNAGFTGNGGTPALDGDDILDRTAVLQPGENIIATITVEIDPTLVPLAGLGNQATASASTPDGGTVSDDSDSGSNPDGNNGEGGTDDPTPLVLQPVPAIMKSVNGAPVALANGHYLVRYDFKIMNNGAGEMCNVEVIDNLAAQLGCAFVNTTTATLIGFDNNSGLSTQPSFSTVFNGDDNDNLFIGDGCLQPGDGLSFYLEVEMDVRCEGLPDPLGNSATLNVQDGDGNVLTDSSDDGTDLDGDLNPDNDSGGSNDPTVVYLPELAISKAQTAATQLPNGNYQLDYRFNVVNTGNAYLSDVTVSDQLTFAAAIVGTPTVTVVNTDADSAPADNNGSYDGSGDINLTLGAAADRLAPGQSFSVYMSVEVDPDVIVALPQPIENQASVAGTPIDENGNELPGYPDISDDSDDGTDLPDGGDPTTGNEGSPNDNGSGGTDDATLVTLPQIKIAKEVLSVVPATTPGNFYVTFNMVMKNTGNVAMDNLQVEDDLQSELGAAYVGITAGPTVTAGAGSPTVPALGNFPPMAFDGMSGLLNPGDEINVEFTVEINPDAGGVQLPLTNQATASATAPNGDGYSDDSDSGADPDGDNGDGSESTPTSIPLPQINAAKEVLDVSPSANGSVNHFDVTYRIRVQNTGSEPLHSISVIEDLAAQMGTAFVQVLGVPSIYAPLTDATIAPSVNAAFTGAAPALDVFSGTPADQLLPGEMIAVDLVVEIDPTAANAPSPISNSATVSGTTPDDMTVSDDSDSGDDPTTDNGDGGFDDPTEFVCLPANIELVASQDDICEGSDVSITLTSDVGAAQYEWVSLANPAAVISTTQNPTFENILVTTTFRVNIFPTDACFTELEETITINVTGTPAAPAVSDVTVCEGSVLQLGTSAIADEYAWDGPNGWTSDDKDPFVTTEAAIVDGGPYTLTVLQGGCWSEVATLTVTVSERPMQPNLTNNSPICEGEDMVLTTSTSCAAYKWVGPAGTSPATLSNPLLNTATNTTTIPATDAAYAAGLWSVICVDASGCESLPSEQVEMVINPIPMTPVPTNNGPICEGGDVTLFGGDSYPDGASFNWYDGNPSDPNSKFVSNEQNPTVYNLAPAGSHVFWLTVTVNGCTSEPASTTVEVTPPPTIAASNNGTECTDPMIDLQLSSNPTGGTPPYTFEWSGPNGFESIDQNPTLPNAENAHSGTYIVTVTDANGCSGVAETVLDVTLAPDEPFITSNGPLCEGEQLILTAPEYEGLEVHYEWTGPLGTTASGAYPDAPEVVRDLVTTASTGDYTVQVTVDGCTSTVSETLQVTINASPETVPSYAYTLNPDCSPSDLQLFANVAAGSGSEIDYAWTGPNGFASTEENPLIPDVTEAYNGSYSLTVSDENGCSATASLEVFGITDILSIPVITSSGQTCEGGAITLTIPAYFGGDVQYTWHLPGSTDNITGLNSNQIIIDPATAAHAGDYRVTVFVDGCTMTSLVYELLIYEAPTVAVANDGTECVEPQTDLNLTATPGGGSGTYTYEWTGPNGFNATGNLAVVPNVNSASSGTYNVLLTDSNGCTATASTVVDVTTRPAEPVVFADGNICAGEEILLEVQTYDGVVVHYEWTGPNGTTLSGAYPDAPFIELGNTGAAQAGEYTVQVTVDGCTSEVSAPYDLVINDLPTVTVSNDGTECINSTTDLLLSASPNGGSGNFTFEWSGPNGFASVEQNPTVPNAGSNDAGTYIVTVTDENGCSVQGETVVDVTTAPAEPFLTSNGPVCEGEQLVISTQQYAGIDVKYEWVGPLGTTSTGAYPNAPELIIDGANPISTGAYAVQVTVDGCSTVLSSPLDVTVNDAPAISPQAAYTLAPDCSPENLSLSANANAGSGQSLTFEWTGPNGFSSGIQNPLIPDVTEQYNGSYTLTVTDENGCSAQASVEVTNISDQVAQPVIVGSPQTCVGETITLSVPEYEGSDVAYNWSLPGLTANVTGLNSNQITIFPAEVTNAGLYSLTVVVDDCTISSLPFEMLIYSPPSLAIANDGTECIIPGTDLNLNSTATGGGGNYTYSWTGPNGFSSSDEDAILPNANSASSGVYSLLVTDENGCTAEASTTIDVTTAPDEPFVTANGPVCEGEEVLIEAPEYAGFDVSYEWVGPQGSTSSGAYPDAPAFAIQLANGTSTGQYAVQVTVDGCTSIQSAAYSLNVNPAPQASPENNGIACSLATNDLELTANASGGSGSYSYQWTGPNGFASNVENPVIPNVTAAASGTYTLVVHDAFGCQSAAASTVVEVTGIPATPVFAMSDNELCEGETLELETTPYNGADVTYTWTIADGTIIETNVPSLVIDSVTTASNDGVYMLSVTVDGCTSLASANVNASVTATPDAPGLPAFFQVCEGQPLTLGTDVQADTYNWTGPNGFVSASQNPNVFAASPASAGTYTLTVENAGCESAMSEVEVAVEALPAVPVLETSSICDGDTIRLEATEIAGYSYQWISPTASLGSDFGTLGDPDNPIWTNGNSTAINAADNPDLYEAGPWTVQAVSANGCVSETAVPIEINIFEIPTAPPALSNGPICEGEELLLLVEDMPNATYSWYDGDPVNPPTGELITTIQNPTLYNVEPGLHQYFLMVEQNGCLSAQGSMVEVQVTDMPDVQSVSNSGPYCVGSTIELNAPNIPGATYSWTGPNGFSSFEEDPVILGANVQNAGIYVLTVENGQCVSAPISTQVLVTGQPVTPVVDNNGPACEGESIQLISPTIPGGQNVVFEWTGPNGFSSNLQNPVLDSLTQDDEGAYYLTVTVDGCGSLISAPTMVEVFDVPGIPAVSNSTTADAPACDGDEIQLETAFIPGATYQWTGPGGFVSFIPNPVIPAASGINEGQYSVIVDVDGCASGQNFTEVFVQEIPSVPVVVSNGPVCAGEDLIMEVANIDTLLTYQWYDSLGNFLVGVGPQLIFDNAQPIINNTYYVVAEMNGCETNPSAINSAGEDAFLVAQVDVPSPDVAFVGDDLFVCEDSVTIVAFPMQFDGTGQWSQLDPNSGSFITRPNELSTLVVNLPEGENNFVWSVISGACGITSSDTLTVNLNGFPEASADLFSVGYNERLDSNVVWNDLPNTDDYFVELLKPTQGGEIIILDNGRFVYQPNGGFVGTDVFEYQLCNVNCPDNCASAIGTIEVGFDAPLDVPSIFTPNGDGVNDEFVIPFLALYEGSELTLFNRWGDEVLHSNDYQNDWDGKYKGEDMPTGTYFYILKVNDGEDTVLTGYLFLQR